MCGRFTQNYTWAQVHAFLSFLGVPRNLRPRYNIAPTTEIDVVRLVEQGRELLPMRWGLVPFFWKKSLKELPATFNACAETIAEKPMFRDAFKKRRCIIPASGFYEWTGGKGDRQPHLFAAADGSPVLAFAGLWDSWRDPATGQSLLSATIIVSGASEWMTPYHDRMPVLLSPEDFDRWLNGTIGPEALKPAAESALREWSSPGASTEPGPSSARKCRPERASIFADTRYQGGWIELTETGAIVAGRMPTDTDDRR